MELILKRMKELNKREKEFIEKIKKETGWTCELFFEKRTLIYFLYKNKKVIGSAVIAKREYAEENHFQKILRKYRYLTNVFVEKKYRKRGIGFSFLKEVLKDKHDVVVNPENIGLNKFYKKVGFKYNKIFSKKCKENIMWKNR